MDPIHPKLVHLPIALAVLLPLVSSGVLLAWWRGWFPKATWSLVLGLAVLLLGSGFVAMRTGEADEERIERLVPEAAIESHEEAAKVFLFGSGLLVAVALLPLLLRRKPLAQTAALATVAGSLAVLALGYRVGAAGGDLVYRHGAAAAFATNATGLPPPAARHGDDDDR